MKYRTQLLPGCQEMTTTPTSIMEIPSSRSLKGIPGAGYAALHPDVEGLDPEDYPDIHKMAILADVAPHSREYNIFRQKIGKEAPKEVLLGRNSLQDTGLLANPPRGPILERNGGSVIRPTSLSTSDVKKNFTAYVVTMSWMQLLL